jgi:hypothetical protein
MISVMLILISSLALPQKPDILVLGKAVYGSFPQAMRCNFYNTKTGGRG